MKRLNLILLNLTTLLVLLSAPSCKRGEGGKDDGLNGFGGSVSTEVLITRDQFEAAGMLIGDPVPVTFSQITIARGYIETSPSGQVNISTLIPGRVKKISCSTGDYVRKGQLLFTLESREIILIQQEYAVAFNELKSVKANYERLKELSEEQVASRKDFINAESAYLSLVSRTEGLKAQLKLIHMDPSRVEEGKIYSDAPVYSPIGGYVTHMDLTLGKFIEPGEAVLEILDTDQLRLNLHLFENDMLNLIVGQAVRFYKPDDPDRGFEAKLTHLGKTIDPETKDRFMYRFP